MEKFEKFSIDAVHPVARRVVKSNLSFNEFKKLLVELIQNGYRDIEISRGKYE